MERLKQQQQRSLLKWRQRLLSKQHARYYAFLNASASLCMVLVLSTLVALLPFSTTAFDRTARWIFGVVSATFCMDFSLIYCLALYVHPAIRATIPRDRRVEIERRNGRTDMKILVMGVGRHSVQLDVSPDWRIWDILVALRRRRLLPALSRLQPLVYYNPAQRGPLAQNRTLGELRVQELSILHVRYSLPGGSTRRYDTDNELEESENADTMPATRRGRGRTARRREEDDRFASLADGEGFNLDEVPIRNESPVRRHARDKNKHSLPVTARHEPDPTPTGQPSSSSAPVGAGPKPAHQERGPPSSSPIPNPSDSSLQQDAPFPLDENVTVHPPQTTPRTTRARPQEASTRKLDQSAIVGLDRDLDFLDAYVHSRLRLYTFNGGLSFKTRPSADVNFEATPLTETTECNHGPYALDPDQACNDQYLEQEEFLATTYRSIAAIASLSLRSQEERCSKLSTLLRQEWTRMEIRKELEWMRQRDAKISSDNLGATFVDSGRYFARPSHLTDPVTVVHHITALLLHLVYRVPRRATRILLIALRSLVKISMGHPLDAEKRALVDSLPIDIRTILGRLNLDPVTHPYICCPACYALYSNPFPQRCTHQVTSSSKPCGARLWRSRTIRGKAMSFPLRIFLYQDLKEWLARLLSRPGIEEIMDSMLKRAQCPVPDTMTDLWDAPVFRELCLLDGTRFVDAPSGEGRYIFGLAADGFNPYQNKDSKQNVSVTAIYLYCLNLPPHLRYRPENMCLVGVIPGPHKPSKDQFNHFLQPLVDDLLKLWSPGVFYSRTEKYPGGRLVRCALVPLVCDLPAARQAAGFGGHRSKYFCSMCKLQYKNINDLDMKTWGERTCEEHKAVAQAWKEKPSVTQRKKAFEQNSIRWSPLLDLPYWDPIRYTVIDSMHNQYLGLLKTHCRGIWGMNARAKDADEIPVVPNAPPAEDVAEALDLVYTGTVKDLNKCKRAVLIHVCNTLGIQRKKKTKPHMIEQIIAWRIAESGSLQAPSSRPSGAEASSNPSVVPPSQPTQSAIKSRDNVLVAEKALLDGNSASTLSSKFNLHVFVTLCQKLGLPVKGKKNVLIKELIAWRWDSKSKNPVPKSPQVTQAIHNPNVNEANHVDDGNSKGSGDAHTAGKAQKPRILNVTDVPEVDPTDSAVLGRVTMKQIQDRIPCTELPSWINPVPANVGTAQRGKLSADQWHMLCVIHLPIVLVDMWYRKSTHHRQMLDNYMDLVTEVVIASLLEMSESAIKLYETAAMRYLQTARKLYDINLVPNQHNSLHIPFFLRFFGPLHPIRTFFSERMNFLLQSLNTNNKFGELELTYMKHSTRSANFRAVMEDPSIRTQVEELAEAFDRVDTEDRRGTRLRESYLLGVDLRPKKEAKPKKITLDDECMAALVTYLNQKAGKEMYIDVREFRRISGTQQLTNNAIKCRRVSCHGVSFLGDSDPPKDSNILFCNRASDSSSAVHAGRIKHIFKYSTCDSRGRLAEATYLYVAPLVPLSSSDAKEDPYRTYPMVGGELYYDRHLLGVVIEPNEVIAHFARTPVSVPGIHDPCIHVLSLDKSLRMVAHVPDLVTGVVEPDEETTVAENDDDDFVMLGEL